MNLVIETITAFVSVDKDGNEGVIGKLGNDGVFMPFVCADEKRVKSILAHAIEIRELTGIPFKILRFSTREDVTENYKL